MATLVEFGHDISGLDADKPANADAGCRYYATDTGVFYVHTGSAWKAIGAGGAGGTVEDEDTVSAGVGNGVQQTILTLTDVPVTVGNTTGVSFGGTKIFEFPQGRILLLGATLAGVTFDLTDEGNVTPIDAADGGDISVGTTIASDGTLTGADVDIIPATSIDPISGGVAGAALAASAQFDGTTTPIPVNLNVLIDDADVGNAASDVVLVSGVLTLAWINLGDY